MANTTNSGIARLRNSKREHKDKPLVGPGIGPGRSAALKIRKRKPKEKVRRV
jgi:hypothetical protein